MGNCDEALKIVTCKLAYTCFDSFSHSLLMCALCDWSELRSSTLAFVLLPLPSVRRSIFFPYCVFFFTANDCADCRGFPPDCSCEDYLFCKNQGCDTGECQPDCLSMQMFSDPVLDKFVSLFSKQICLAILVVH